MINRTAIQQWSDHAPWIDNAQIEQDLIICRALVAIFSDEFLASRLSVAPSVISTKRSAWRDLSTTLEMTKDYV